MPKPRAVWHIQSLLISATSLPVYEPGREKVIYANVRAANQGPLPDIELTHIYERIIDVMRALQRNELASERHARETGSGHETGQDTGHDTGASAPENLVEELIGSLQGRGYSALEEMEITEEDVRFNLPSELSRTVKLRTVARV